MFSVTINQFKRMLLVVKAISFKMNIKHKCHGLEISDKYAMLN